MDVTEDNFSTGDIAIPGHLVASGSVPIDDVAPEQSLIEVLPGTHLGNLALLGGNSYQYDVDNALVQMLGNGQTISDVFTVRTANKTTHDLQFTIHGANDAPTVAGAISLGTASGSITISEAQLLANVTETDASDVLHVTGLTVASSSGQLVANANQTWTFTPNSGASGPVTINYQVTDGTVTVSNSASLTVQSTIIGQPGTDREGTAASDTIILGQTNLLTNAGAGNDVIRDFSKVTGCKRTSLTAVAAPIQLTSAMVVRRKA